MDALLEPALPSAPTLAAALASAGLQSLLLVYALHRATLLRAPRRPPAPPFAGPPWPRVTVQLPVYEEPHVVERLIACVARLDWPRDRLEVQVLDDSAEPSAAIAARAVARARAAGLDIVHPRRASRAGFKAGALRDGLASARGEFIAIFDADFLPPPDFLRRMLPHFADPAVGMAQARWGHLNRDASPLTAAQAVMLDAHFDREHAARMARGHFFNFNGSGGVWRRRCIEDAGGWSDATLTEDLDLSYRAQLRGWRFVYDGTVEVPAELPSEPDALLGQQRRWVKGSIQTARRVLPALLRAPLPAALKIEATLHLTGNLAYALLLALAALTLPAAFAAPWWPGAGWLHAATLALGLTPVALYLGSAQRAPGRPLFRRIADVALAIALGMGLSLNNARAVVEGLVTRGGVFERTPKTGERGPRALRRVSWASPPRAERILAVTFAAVFAAAAVRGDLRTAPFALLLAAGFALVGAPEPRPRPATAGPPSETSGR